jgi:hypothetical protein
MTGHVMGGVLHLLMVLGLNQSHVDMHFVGAIV